MAWVASAVSTRAAAALRSSGCLGIGASAHQPEHVRTQFRLCDHRHAKRCAEVHIDVCHFWIPLAHRAEIGYPGNIADGFKVILHGRERVTDPFETGVIDQEVHVRKISGRLFDIPRARMIDLPAGQRQSFMDTNVLDPDLA